MRVDDSPAGACIPQTSGPAGERRLDGRQRLRIAVPCWAAVVLASVFAFAVPRFHVPRIDAGFNPSPVAVGVGHELVQTFRVEAQGLDTIVLEVVDSSPDLAVAFDVGVRQGAVIAVLHRQTLSFAPGGRSVVLKFAPLPREKDLVYAVRIRPLGSDASAHVTLRATEGHVYPEGAVWLDGVELPLDLVMRVDAATAQPWRAVAALLQRRTGVPGIEWVVAAVYLGAVLLILRGLASLGG